MGVQSQRQSQGLGGLSLISTNDLSGTVSDVTNGNTIGSAYKNAVGIFVVADTGNADSFVLASVITVPVLGVLGDTPKAGQPGQIDSVAGTITKVWSGGAISIGNRLVTDSSGRAVAVSTTPAYVAAVALESASGAGYLISARLAEFYIPTTP